MSKAKYITYEQLRRLGACHRALRSFERRHGKRARVTIAGCVREAKLWPWGWLNDALGYIGGHRGSEMNCPRCQFNKASVDKRAEMFARNYLKRARP